MSQVVRTLRNHLLRKRIDSRNELYEKAHSLEERLAIQLSHWNREWKDIQTRVPYYVDLVKQGVVPREFASLEEYVATMPITTKQHVQEEVSERTDPIRDPEGYRISGGTTSEPVAMPSWKSEDRILTPNMWLGRSWYGVRPGSKLFLLWGHSHLLGTGFRGMQKKWLRKIKDRLNGYCRFSGYDISESKLDLAVDTMLRFRPEYIVGYANALGQFALVAQKRKEELRQLGVKAIFGTAEAYRSEESEPLLAEIFNAQTGMEYGAVETGLLGHTHPEGGYRAFWNEYFLEIQKDSPSDSSGKLLITSLYPRCFPLVRYQIGDELVFPEQEGPIIGISGFSKLHGRSNEYINLGSGVQIHTVAFCHTINQSRDIQQIQVIQDGDYLEIHYISHAELSSEGLQEIRQKLKKVHPSLENVALKRVGKLEQTIAGKTPTSIRRS